MDSLRQDLRYAVRSLSRSPGFTAVAVLTLALGIGATTAVFSIVNGVLLKPLPYPNAERVTYLGFEWTGGGIASSSTALQFSYVQEHARVFEGVATYRFLSAGLGDGSGSGWVDGIRVSEDFFAVVGTRPMIGRPFTPGESESGGPEVAVLGHDLWRARFAADPDVVGRTIRLDNKVHTVVGVMPPDFRFIGLEDRADVLVPLQLDPDPADLGQNYTVLARVRPGVTPTQVEADLAQVFHGLADEYPDQAGGRAGIQRMDYEEVFLGDLRTTLLVLLGATLFVLLIACADVANLLLARATGRKREIATRAALGAGRRRIVRQLLTEALVLGLVAGAAGLLIGVWSVDALLATAPRPIPRVEEIGLDTRVLGFALVLALTTAAAFGLASAMTASRLDLTSALKGGGRGESGDRARTRTRNTLIVAEAAVSLVLLIGAGLLIVSFLELRRVEPGFNPENLLTVEIERTPAGYGGAEQVLRFQQQAIDRIRAIPGVTAAAGVSALPLAGQFNFPMTVEGRPADYETAIQIRVISDGYFQTMETPLLRGRDLTAADMSGAPVAIINQATAARYWPGGDALGQRVLIGQFGEMRVPGFPVVPHEIVGIAADMRALGLDQPAPRMIFTSQTADRTARLPAFVIRAPSSSAIRDAVARAIHETDPRMTELEFRQMSQVAAASVARESFTMLLMTLFAGVALVLTVLGIYGVISYSVGERIREIGVRIALGARREDVLRLVVKQGMLPVMIGLGIGIVAAAGLTRVLASLLYEVGARDPGTFVAVALLMAVVALAAAYLPARRATRLDPMVALRAE